MDNYSVVREIKVGGKWRIHGSYGYAGIAEGIITIVDILPTGHSTPEVAQVAVAWSEAILGCTIDQYHNGDIDELIEEWVRDEINIHNTEPWVAYTYDNNEEEGILYMPVHVFVNHITVL